MEQVPTCCPPLATSIECGVFYDSTSPSLDRPSSTTRLHSRFENARAGCYWHRTIPSSSLSIGSHSAARTGSHSPLVGSAGQVVPHYLSVSRVAEPVQSFPRVHPASPTAWYNSFDTPCRLFG